MDLSNALENGVRLAQVRNAKRNLMIVQVVIVLAAVIVLTYMGGDIQLKPFYFNIGSILYFMILIALVIGVEGFFFTYLEQWYTKSFSAKSYMLKRSIRRSLIVIAIAAVAMFLVLTPFIANGIANATSESGKTMTVATFDNRDELGLTAVDTIHVVSGSPAEVIVVSAANYEQYAGSMEALRQHAVLTADDTSPGLDLTFPDSPFGMYYIVVNSDQSVEVSYTVHRTLSPTFVAFISMFSLLFIGIYAAWVLMAMKIRSRFTKSSVYR
ncbi:MAG: hypothetical protein SA339_00375 [Methanomassiliicoccus sp.]|nr:hypothetical protein [Methanomassiliicoccus sp.]